MMALSDNKQDIQILALAGSLRKDSYNKALLQAAKELAPESLNIRIFGLEGIPLYNADVEAQGDPEQVPSSKKPFARPIVCSLQPLNITTEYRG